MSTTLEILAPYLPHGIEIQAKDGGPREKVIGLCYNATELVNVEYHDKPLKNYWFGVKHCLPVLRSFADLCTPLADGTVPAVEVAKLLANDWAGENRYESEIRIIGDCHIQCFKEAGYMDEDEETLCSFFVLKDWNFLISGENESGYTNMENLLEAYDYLRSKHFAVGLTPDQYIRKEA